MWQFGKFASVFISPHFNWNSVLPDHNHQQCKLLELWTYEFRKIPRKVYGHFKDWKFCTNFWTIQNGLCLFFQPKCLCPVPSVRNYNQPNILNSPYNVEAIVGIQCIQLCIAVVCLSPPIAECSAVSPQHVTSTHDRACVCTTMLFAYLCICVFVYTREKYTFEWRFFFCSIRKSSFVHTGITYCAFNSIRSYTFVRSVCCVLSVANVRAFFLFALFFIHIFCIQVQPLQKNNQFLFENQSSSAKREKYHKENISLLFKIIHTS